MTDINKLIEQEAERYAQYNGVMPKASFDIHKQFAIKTFIRGANFILHQNRWRKVEEELPKEDKCRTSLPVLINTKYGEYKVAYYSYKSRGFVQGDVFIHGVTHWKPIPNNY